MMAAGTGEGRRGAYRRAGAVLARTIGPFAGTLLLVPLAVAIAGSTWTWERVVLPGSVTLVEGKGGNRASTERRCWLFQDGTTWERGIVIPRGGYLEVRLERPVRTFAVTLQANLAESYLVQVSSGGTRFETVWTAGGTGSGNVLETIQGPVVTRPGGVSRLRIVPARGQDRFAVSWVSVRRPPLVFHHAVLPPILWGTWLLLLLGTRVRVLARPAGRVLEAWAHADLVVAPILAFAVLFQVPGVAFLWVLPLLALAALVYFVRRAPLTATLTIVGAALVLGVVMPRLLTRVVIAGIARFHELNVDHRMRPYVMEDINGDGIRFRGEASDLDSGQFVVLFLGDSFTYGFHLDYDETYPAQFQDMLARRGCRDVVAVNMGWTSSSPLLGLRLLKEIGYRYRPDLVVYNLDMTDFSDDLRYEEALARGGDLAPDTGAVVQKLLAMYLPGLAANLGAFSGLEAPLRWRGVARRRPDGRVQRGTTFSGEKFFVTNHPLEQTRADIERGVMKNLAALHTFCDEVLHVPMVLVVYPRAYQYSLRESRNNDEKGLYEPLGPYVREPFKYFEEAGGRLPYPVISTLDAFESAADFPLYFDDDPHWTPAGARVAARAVAHRLAAEGLVPCDVR